MNVVLKPGRDKSLKARHPWIFSGAIDKLPDFTDGDILSVCSATGEQLGSGYFNRRSSIIGRMITFDSRDPHTALLANIDEAIQMRKVVKCCPTNAQRLINAEADLLPGLIVDQFADILVVQISTLGMERLKPVIARHLQERLLPSWIYEASSSPSRKEEGLTECRQTFSGSPVNEVAITEDGLKFFVNPSRGQKTGFFQDHREMRLLIQQQAAQRRVLNCFSYTGAFSCHALKGGATQCDSVDISKEAIREAGRHMELNGFDATRHQEIVADCFDFLQSSPLNYDLIILDPPAFAKRQSDVKAAVRGYQEINRRALSKMPKSSLLLTCSCSYHVGDELFVKMLFHASKEANRELRIIQRHRLAFDHPISIYHPESSYLKSFLCYVS